MIFLPNDIYVYLEINSLISKYWLVAIPCHFFTTLVFIIIFFYLLFLVKDKDIKLNEGNFILNKRSITLL